MRAGFEGATLADPRLFPNPLSVEKGKKPLEGCKRGRARACVYALNPILPLPFP